MDNHIQQRLEAAKKLQAIVEEMAKDGRAIPDTTHNVPATCVADVLEASGYYDD